MMIQCSSEAPKDVQLNYACGVNHQGSQCRFQSRQRASNDEHQSTYHGGHNPSANIVGGKHEEEKQHGKSVIIQMG